MKIGHFISAGTGGADRCALEIIRGLIEHGLTPLIFYSDKSIPGPVLGDHNPNNPILNRLDQFAALATMIKIGPTSDLLNYNLDILHTHRSGDDLWLLPRLETLLAPFKIVETNFHGSRNTRADIRCYTSQAVMNHYGIKPDSRNIVIPNAIGIPMTGENHKAELGLADKLVYGRIARSDLSAYSGINLQAYKRIETDQTALFYCAPHTRAREDAARLGIKNIVWHDPVIDLIELSKLYNTMDVFLHAQPLGETFSNTICEAAMHGLPVVSHIGKANEWPQAHIALFNASSDTQKMCVPAGDVGGYAHQMELLKNQDYRIKIRTEMHNYVKNNFSYKVVSKQYLDLYKTLLGQ